jgi:hypothetical protein
MYFYELSISEYNDLSVSRHKWSLEHTFDAQVPKASTASYEQSLYAMCYQYLPFKYGPKPKVTPQGRAVLVCVPLPTLAYALMCSLVHKQERDKLKQYQKKVCQSHLLGIV